MTVVSNRRSFLKATLGGAAVASLSEWTPLPAFAREKVTNLTAGRLNDRISVISGAGANVVAMSGPDGALLVDGGLEARSGELVKLALAQTAAKRVHTLINTHWHPEQTGSNERLGKAGARIISHENTKLWLGYQNPLPWAGTQYGPLPANALPNSTTFGSGSLDFGGQKVNYGYLLQAHTDGDLYVLFPDSNVLAAGGAVSSEGWPIIDYNTGGWIGGLVAGLDKLIKLSDENTRIVPANGPVVTRADLEAQRKVYFTLYDRLVKSLTQGLGPEEAAAAEPAKGFNAQWGDARPFVLMAFKSLWGHYAPDA